VKEIYLFSYFKGPGDGLHLAVSDDCYHWIALHHDQVFLNPAVGEEKIMRDPCIYFGRDQQFHLVWTCGWHEKGIGYASSKDLITWNDQQFLPLMLHEEKTRNCWAPEIFFHDEKSEYIIYWSSTVDGKFPETLPYGDDGLNHRIYATTTSDFKTFSKTFLFYDPGFNVIDANLIKADDEYFLFMKDETLSPPKKHIRFTRGKQLGEFGSVSEAITLNHYWAEGPTAIKNADEWIVFFDKYKINEMGAVRSRDLKHWEDISHQITFPAGAQHGFVTKVPLHSISHLLPMAHVFKNVTQKML